MIFRKPWSVPYYYSAGYAASLTWGNEVIAGMAGGFAGGFVGSGGNLKAGIIGGVTGGVAGNINSIYGDTWNWQRVGANSVVGGVGSELNGGQFKDGFKTNFAFSATTYAAVSMREYEWAESQKNPNNSSGESAGFRGIGRKMGGERQNCCDLEGNLLPMTGPGSPLGGWQGGRGRLFWMDYAPDSWQDHLVESFGGVHDFLNHPVWYDTNGNAKVLTGFGKFIGEGVNAANVLVATPIVAMSVVPEYTYGALDVIKRK